MEEKLHEPGGEGRERRKEVSEGVNCLETLSSASPDTFLHSRTWKVTGQFLSSCLQSGNDVLEGVVATKSTPGGVDLKLSNYSTTAAMNGSIASANNATLATVAAN